MPVLTATRVGKSFGADDIFAGINVDIPHGTRIALVGPNGAGKTTLLRILIRAEDPSAGQRFQPQGRSKCSLPHPPPHTAHPPLTDHNPPPLRPLQPTQL